MLLALDFNFSKIDPHPFKLCKWPLDSIQNEALCLLIDSGNREGLNLKIIQEFSICDTTITLIGKKFSDLKYQLGCQIRDLMEIPTTAYEFRNYFAKYLDSKTACKLKKLTYRVFSSGVYDKDEDPWKKITYWKELAKRCSANLDSTDENLSKLSKIQLSNLVHYRLANIPISDAIRKILECCEPSLTKEHLLRLCLLSPPPDFYLS